MIHIDSVDIVPTADKHRRTPGKKIPPSRIIIQFNSVINQLMLQRLGNLGGDICFRHGLSSCGKKKKSTVEGRNEREDISKIGK